MRKKETSIGRRTRLPGSRPKATAPRPVVGNRGQPGVAILLVLVVLTILSGLAVSLVLLTDSQSRLTNTVQTQAQVYYAALAGLEEARGRLNPSAPDAISTTSLPTTTTGVLYLVNSSTLDPVQPTNTSSPYYDYEYAQEFSGGFSSATVLGPVSSDQPGAGTASAIPYKWVRITLKTEYSSKQDVNQDGILDPTTTINWYGSNQNLSTAAAGGVPVYKLTALAVAPSGIRKMGQMEVAAIPNTNSAAVATAATASLSGVTASGKSNLTVDGNDACEVASDLPGVMAGSTVTTSVATVTGSPTPTQQNVSPFPQSASALISSLRPAATPILYADPTHVSVSSGGTSYNGTNVVLGTQPSGTTPAQPLVVYSDKPLTISGKSSIGDGILLVNGNLTVDAGFNYRGKIVANGTVTLTSGGTGSISIQGTVISSGNFSANSAASNSTSLSVTFNSCAIAESYQILPLTILAFRDLR